MKQISKIAENHYEKGYKKLGINYQRRYPNEELCRFMGRNFFSYKKNKRKKIKILETGCGSGGNLWMIAQEQFLAYGIDISNQSIKIAKKLFEEKKINGFFRKGNFAHMSYDNLYFDAVCDVFSSCCLDKVEGKNYIGEVNRVLKKNGKFFSYFPSKKSNMFKHSSKVMHDSDTLISLKKKSPYKVDHPIRFMKMSEYCLLLEQNGFSIDYKEEIMRTYFSGKDKFYFLVIEAKKL